MSKVKKFIRETNEELKADLILSVIFYVLGLALLIIGVGVWAPLALVGVLFIFLGLLLTFGPFLFF